MDELKCITALIVLFTLVSVRLYWWRHSHMKDYSAIDKMPVLIVLWHSASSKSKQKPIEERMVEVLATIYCMSELTGIWRETSDKSIPRRLVEERIRELGNNKQLA